MVLNDKYLPATNYNVMKWRKRKVSSGGTITDMVYEPRGLVIGTCIGTNDHGGTEVQVLDERQRRSESLCCEFGLTRDGKKPLVVARRLRRLSADRRIQRVIALSWLANCRRHCWEAPHTHSRAHKRPDILWHFCGTR